MVGSSIQSYRFNQLEHAVKCSTQLWGDQSPLHRKHYLQLYRVFEGNEENTQQKELFLNHSHCQQKISQCFGISLQAIPSNKTWSTESCLKECTSSDWKRRKNQVRSCLSIRNPFCSSRKWRLYRSNYEDDQLHDRKNWWWVRRFFKVHERSIYIGLQTSFQKEEKWRGRRFSWTHPWRQGL